MCLCVTPLQFIGEVNDPSASVGEVLYTAYAGWAVTAVIAVNFGTAHGKL